MNASLRTTQDLHAAYLLSCGYDDAYVTQTIQTSEGLTEVSARDALEAGRKVYETVAEANQSTLNGQ